MVTAAAAAEGFQEAGRLVIQSRAITLSVGHQPFLLFWENEPGMRPPPNKELALVLFQNRNSPCSSLSTARTVLKFIYPLSLALYLYPLHDGPQVQRLCDTHERWFVDQHEHFIEHIPIWATHSPHLFRPQPCATSRRPDARHHRARHCQPPSAATTTPKTATEHPRLYFPKALLVATLCRP